MFLTNGNVSNKCTYPVNSFFIIPSKSNSAGSLFTLSRSDLRKSVSSEKYTWLGNHGRGNLSYCCMLTTHMYLVLMLSLLCENVSLSKCLISVNDLCLQKYIWRDYIVEIKQMGAWAIHLSPWSSCCFRHVSTHSHQIRVLTFWTITLGLWN